MLFSRILSLIILFVLWIIIIIVSIYSNLIIRLIFIYSILIIINSSFLIAKFNYDKYSHVHNNEYELLNETKKHLLIQNKKRSIYFVLMDEMTSINEAIKLGVLETASVIKEIEKTGLRYIPNSLSSYNLSYLTLASIFNLDYPVTSKSNQYFDRTYFFPNLLIDEDIDVPLLSYLNLVNSKLYWIGNIWAL